MPRRLRESAHVTQKGWQLLRAIEWHFGVVSKLNCGAGGGVGGEEVDAHAVVLQPAQEGLCDEEVQQGC